MIRPWPEGDSFVEVFSEDETFARVRRSADQVPSYAKSKGCAGNRLWCAPFRPLPVGCVHVRDGKHATQNHRNNMLRTAVPSGLRRNNVCSVSADSSLCTFSGKRKDLVGQAILFCGPRAPYPAYLRAPPHSHPALSPCLVVVYLLPHFRRPFRLFVSDRTLAGHQLVRLSDDLDASAAAIRGQQLDVLVFPELGLDPVTYFLSFARLAPVQVRRSKRWNRTAPSTALNVLVRGKAELALEKARDGTKMGLAGRERGGESKRETEREEDRNSRNTRKGESWGGSRTSTAFLACWGRRLVLRIVICPCYFHRAFFFHSFCTTRSTCLVGVCPCTAPFP